MTDLLPEHPQHGLVCCFLEFPVRKTATIYPKMIGPFPNPTKKGAVHISCFTWVKRSGSRLRRKYFRSFVLFSVPLSCPYKVRDPRRNIYNMVWCFVISCALLKTPQEKYLNKNLESNIIRLYLFGFSIPPPLSCRHKKTCFLPSTCKMDWRCCSFLLKNAA